MSALASKAFQMLARYIPSRGYWGVASGLVPEQQVLLILRDSGLVPKGASRVQQLKAMLQSSLRPEGCLSFSDFLKIVAHLKEQEKEKVGKVIDETTENKCCIPAKELCGFFRACGFITKVGVDLIC